MSIRGQERSGGRRIFSIGQLADTLRVRLVRELHVRYKSSLLGLPWAVLSPVGTVLVLHLLFTPGGDRHVSPNLIAADTSHLLPHDRSISDSLALSERLTDAVRRRLARSSGPLADAADSPAHRSFFVLRATGQM